MGAAKTIGNLTVFPIFGRAQQSLGEFTTLERALAAKKAVVREHTGDARVNELVIENKGARKILVLAGTIVKGGNQDRQVAQDFVISSNATQPIDAFCVEKGRWDGSRAGKATGGKFVALDALASTRVRAAGQYKGNQADVWSEVAKFNMKNRKSSSSGTLTASLDAADIIKQRDAKAKKVNAFLAGVTPQKRLVGFAYAIDGKVRNVRWFMNGEVFRMLKAPLVNAAVLEAITAQAAAKSKKKKARSHRMHPGAVARFVNKIAAAKKKKKKKGKAGNAYEYRFSDDAASSKTYYAPSPYAKPKKVTEDYSAY